MTPPTAPIILASALIYAVVLGVGVGVGLGLGTVRATERSYEPAGPFPSTAPRPAPSIAPLVCELGKYQPSGSRSCVICPVVTTNITDCERTVSTVNGQVPPGVPTELTNSTTVVDAVNEENINILVYLDARLPGTRAPIHYHP